MVAVWPTLPLTNGHLVDDDDWNQHVDNLNDLNTRIGTGNGTALASRVSTLETRTLDTSGTVGIGNQRLSDRLGSGITTAATASDRFGTGVGTGSNVTTGSATSQLTDLRSRMTAAEGVNTTQGSSITALNSAVGIPWSGGTALSRIQALEAGSPSAQPSGHWSAPAVSPTAISASTSPTDTFISYSQVVKAPVGVSISAGTITIGAGNGGWYQIEARYDVAMTLGTTQRADCIVATGAGALLGVDTRFYPATGWSFHSWTSLVYLAAGDTVKVGMKFWTTTGSGTYALVTSDGTRNWLKIARVAN